MSSRFTHVTVVPTATFPTGGAKLKLAILISLLPGAAWAAATAGGVPEPTSASMDARPRMETARFTIMVMPFIGPERSAQGGVDERQVMPALHVGHFGDAQQSAQLP